MAKRFRIGAAIKMQDQQRRKRWRERALKKNKRKRCPVCGLPFNTRERRPTVDHVVPLSRGGADVASNWQLLCMACNQRKADSMPEGGA